MTATGYPMPRLPYPASVAAPDTRLRTIPTARLSDADSAAVRALLEAAFKRDEQGGFTWDDWLHALGGVHFVLDRDGEVVAHAAVVERTLEIAGRPVRTGYVEAVAVLPDLQQLGLGTVIMQSVDTYVSERFALGALGTGKHHFYERLGWRVWLGPTGVRADGAFRPTPEEDGYILVLPTPTSPPFTRTEPLSCDWRPGDVW
jgi:aminoglycoside 2'-N-acetyltransferase I